MLTIVAQNVHRQPWPWPRAKTKPKPKPIAAAAAAAGTLESFPGASISDL